MRQMALVSKTIRFDPQAWEYISREAAHMGIPASEFVRTAALARAAFNISRRSPDEAAEFNELYDAAQRLSAQFDDDA